MKLSQTRRHPDWLSSKSLSSYTFVSRRDFLSVSKERSWISRAPLQLPALIGRCTGNGTGTEEARQHDYNLVSTVNRELSAASFLVLDETFHMHDNMKKKKQRARKLTKKQHENVPVGEASRSSRSDRLEFESFLSEVTRWFSDRQLQVDELFSHSDADRSGSVNLKDFYQGLMNLDVPCQQSQLHMLTQQLKTPDNMISYQDLSGQVQRLRLSDDTEIDSQMSECDRHQLFKPEHDKRFIRLSVRLIPFDSAAAHPGNFEVVLLSSSRVFGLIRMIQDRVGIQTSRLEVFWSRVPTEEARLPPESLLEECGFRGGPEGAPPANTVYYDYSLPFTDCPILNCDHYFRSTPRAAATSSDHCRSST